MNDLNYFDSYIDKRKVKINKQIVYYIMLILVICFTIVYLIINHFRIRALSKDINKMKAVIEDKRIISKIDKIEEKETQLDSLKSSLYEIKLLNDYIEKNNIIDNYLLEMITSSTPDDIFFTSVSMYSDHIEIIGKSKDQLSIGKLIENLESVEVFKRVFVSSISKEEQFYNFILNIDMKDVNMDGDSDSVEETQAPEETK